MTCMRSTPNAFEPPFLSRFGNGFDGPQSATNKIMLQLKHRSGGRRPANETGCCKDISVAEMQERPLSKRNRTEITSGPAYRRDDPLAPDRSRCKDNIYH